MPFCPPQIPNYLSRARTRASAVGRQWIHLAEEQEVVAATYENGNEVSGYVRYWQFLEYRSNY
jgi:hypothetical protein